MSNSATASSEERASLDDSRKMASFRGIFPGAFTMGNMLCGFFSILSAHNNEPARAAWFVVLAGFLDGLDGKVARLSKGTSQFGKELDSLADIVSFGVAPAFLIWSSVLGNFDRWGFMIGGVYLMAGAFRLARYNVVSDPHTKSHFVGLPIPVAAITICSYVIMSMSQFKEIMYPEFVVSMVIACSALMVSNVIYDSIPERFDRRENRWRMALIFVFLIAVLIKPRLMLFPFLAGYVLYGVVREGFRVMNATRRNSRDKKDVE